MKSGTFVVLVAAIGVLVFLATRKSDGPPAPSAISISGYLDKATQDEWQKRKDNPILFLNEKEEDRKKRFKEAAWDEVVVTREGKSVTLKKEGEDEWKLAAPATGEVESYRAKAMIEAFATDTALDPAQAVSSEELLVDYGLDAKRAIQVTLKEKGIAKVDLVIGAAKKLEKAGEDGGPESYDTFVLMPGDAKQVYVARRKDLRTPFAVELAELRSKKVFPFDLTEINRVTIEDPAAGDAKKIVVSAAWTDKPKDAVPEEKPAGAEEKKDDKPEKDGKWTLVEPTVPDFTLQEMRSYWSSVAGIRVNEWVMEAPKPETGLTDATKVARLTVELADGKKHVVLFGAEKEKDKSLYAMIEGSGEYFIASDFTKKNLIKALAELRDKNVLGIADDTEVTKISIKSEHTPDGPMVFEKTGEAWTLTPPPAAQATLGVSLTPDESEIKALVSGLRYFRATDFVTPAPKLEDVGLATPAITVTATIKGVERTLSIGSVEKDSKVHGRIDGTELYFTLGSWSRDKFLKKPIDFKNKRMTDVNPDEVTALELNHGTELVTLTKGATGWQMTAPEAITKDTGLDETVVTSVARAFQTFDVKAFTDKTKDGVGLATPAFTLTATLKDGTTRKLFVSDTTEGEAHYVAIEAPNVDPAAVFTLDKWRVQNFRKKLADLKPAK